jgi:hypothetical protein
MDDVDTFLEHYGVKGMRWGVRNKSNYSVSHPSSKFSKKKKVAIGIGVGSAAIGATFAAVLLKRKLKLNSSRVDKSVNIGKKIVDEWEDGDKWDILDKKTQGPEGTAFRGMNFKNSPFMNDD